MRRKATSSNASVRGSSGHMGVRPEAQGAGGAERADTPTAISGHGPVSILPHSEQSLYAAAGEVEVCGAGELSRDGTGVAGAGLGCVGAGGSAAQTDHGDLTRDMFVDGETRMAVGGEVREAKRRKQCTPRYNPNSLSRAPAPGTAHTVALCPGDTIAKKQTQRMQNWCKFIVQSPHHKGGYAITPTAASGLAAFYSATAKFARKPSDCSSRCMCVHYCRT